MGKDDRESQRQSERVRVGWLLCGLCVSVTMEVLLQLTALRCCLSVRAPGLLLLLLLPNDA